MQSILALCCRSQVAGRRLDSWTLMSAVQLRVTDKPELENSMAWRSYNELAR